MTVGSAVIMASVASLGTDFAILPKLEKQRIKYILTGIEVG